MTLCAYSALCRLLIPVFALSAMQASADDASDNLLLLPAARLQTELALSGQDRFVPDLIDGNPDSVATIPVSGAGPVDFVFDFGDQIVSPDRLLLRLPADAKARPPARIDILVSTTAPTGGFRSMRTEAIDGLKREISVRFRPSAARWIMLRLYPAAEAQSLSVADLVVSGRVGPPETTYDFGETPAKAIEILAELSALSVGEFALTDEERVVFDRAAEGRLDPATFEMAALLASGITNAAQLKMYSAQLDALEAEARAALDTGSAPNELGARLLTWLHARALNGGYREKQTDLSMVLDEGVFNCVSSAVLYASMGLRLGLDVRGIEVPDHAFAIVYDGADHMDVETTTGHGFNPQRDRIAEFEQLTGFNYIPQTNKAKRREIDEAGLAALIYYNHGVGFLDEGRYYDAVMANFRAMNLDPEFASAATNTLAALGRWSVGLSEQGRWEDAVRVAALGRRLAPDDDGLVAHQLAVWQRWATAVADAGRPVDAVALLQRAAAEAPDSGFAEMQAWIYIRVGEDLAQTAKWDAALNAVDPGFSILDGAALDELKDWRRGLFLRWANSEIANASFPAAADVLARALADYPRDDRLSRTVAYLGQEWARHAPDYEAGIAALEQMRVRFRGIGQIDEVSRVFVANEVARLQSTLPLEQSLALVEQAGAILPEAARSDLGALVFETYGHALIETGDWEGAAAIYAGGLQRFPEDYLLSRNARYVVQEWQREAYAEAGPEGLAAVSQRLLALLPQFGNATGETEVGRRVSELVADGKFDVAQTTLDAAQLLLPPDGFEKLAVLVIDRRARIPMADGDWATAASIYAEGLARFPKNRTLSKNAVYVAQEWTRIADADGGAEAVLAVAEVLGQLYPGNDDVAAMGFATLRRSVTAKIAQGQYDAAKAVIAAAAPYLSADDTRDLVVALYDVWGHSKIDAGDWPGAAAVYSEGLSIVPDSRDLGRNAAYVIQEWSAEALRDGGPPAFVEVARKARKSLAALDSLDRVLGSVAGRDVQRMVDAGTPEQAIALVETAAEVLPDKNVIDLKELAYDQWARGLGDKGDWVEALRVYDLGLADVPNSGLLKNNREYAASKTR